MNTMLTRRDLGKLALAAGPLCLQSAWAKPDSKIRGVLIGVQTYSFRQGVPKTEIIPDMVKIGLSEAELMSGDAEALAKAPAMAMGYGRGPRTPEQTAAMEEARKSMTSWRAATTPATFEAVRKMFTDAGIDVGILCYNMGRTVADDEIDYAFRMAKAMKVRAISSSSTVSVAKRVAPFADKYKTVWAGHGHDNVKDPEEFARPETFEEIMSFSKYINVNLDVGHFYAAGFDPIPFIQKHHARISNVHLKDRKKNMDDKRGANLPWGEGETPIKEVLLLMRKEKYPFPANIEMEYGVPKDSDSVAEVAKCYEYAKRILES